jgi:hypothetical protein
VLLISLSTIAVVGCSKKQSSIDESLVNGNDVISVEIDKTTDITDNIASNEEITSEEITESNTENITDNTTENITEDNSVSESNETEAETAEAEQDKENSGNKEEDIEETTDDKEVKEEKPIESEPVVEKPSVDDKETKKEDKKDTEKDKKEDKKEDKKDTEKDKKDKVENNDKDNIDKDKKEPTATPTPKAEPTKKPTPTPTQKPKPTPTPKPTATPTPEPKPTEEPKPTKAPTNKAKTEKFYGVEIVGVDKFVSPKEGWNNNYEDLKELEAVLDEKYPHKEGLYVGTTEIEFSHLDSTSNALELVKSGDGYKIILRARLKVVNEYGIEDEAKLNRDMLKIFLMKITPEYETVYNDIYRDAEVDDVFSEDKWIKSGDVMVKVDMTADEGVVYKIKKAN